jgi:hypothetical protein
MTVRPVTPVSETSPETTIATSGAVAPVRTTAPNAPCVSWALGPVPAPTVAVTSVAPRCSSRVVPSYVEATATPPAVTVSRSPNTMVVAPSVSAKSPRSARSPSSV